MEASLFGKRVRLHYCRGQCVTHRAQSKDGWLGANPSLASKGRREVSNFSPNRGRNNHGKTMSTFLLKNRFFRAIIFRAFALSQKPILGSSYFGCCQVQLYIAVLLKR